MALSFLAGDDRARLTAIQKSQAIIEFSPDGRIQSANPNFLAAMGYGLDEIRGKHHSMFVDAAYRDSADYKAFWAALNRGEHQAAQFKRFGKGGREVWLEASYNPVVNRAGRVTAVLKCATDISAEKASVTASAVCSHAAKQAPWGAGWLPARGRSGVYDAPGLSSRVRRAAWALQMQ